MTEQSRTGVEESTSIVRRASRLPLRPALSVEEGRTALGLARELEADGLKAVLEPFAEQSAPGGPGLFHLLAALAASLVSLFSPLVGVLIGVAVLVSLLGEISGRYRLLRRIFPRNGAYNLSVSPPDGDGVDGKGGTESEDGPQRLLICAGFDAGPRDLLDTPRPGGLLAGWLGTSGPRGALLLTLLVALQPLVAFWSVMAPGLSAAGIARVGCAALLALTWIVGAVDRSIQGRSLPEWCGRLAPAVALEAAKGLWSAPQPGLSVSLLLAGGSGDQGIGLRRYVEEHREELNPSCTHLICVDTRPGMGRRVAHSCLDGSLMESSHDPELASTMAWAAARLGLSNEPVRLGRLGEATQATLAGYRATTLVLDPDAEGGDTMRAGWGAHPGVELIATAARMIATSTEGRE